MNSSRNIYKCMYVWMCVYDAMLYYHFKSLYYYISIECNTSENLFVVSFYKMFNQVHCLVAMLEKVTNKNNNKEAKKLLSYTFYGEKANKIFNMQFFFAHGSAESQFHLIDGWLLLSKILSWS